MTHNNSIRAKREELGLSQEDLAFLVGGETPGMVSRHEHGNRMPTLEMAFGYAAVLGTDVSEIYKNLLVEMRTKVKEKAEKLIRKGVDPGSLRYQTLKRFAN